MALADTPAARRGTGSARRSRRRSGSQRSWRAAPRAPGRPRTYAANPLEHWRADAPALAAAWCSTPALQIGRVDPDSQGQPLGGWGPCSGWTRAGRAPGRRSGCPAGSEFTLTWVCSRAPGADPSGLRAFQTAAVDDPSAHLDRRSGEWIAMQAACRSVARPSPEIATCDADPPLTAGRISTAFRESDNREKSCRRSVAGKVALVAGDPRSGTRHRGRVRRGRATVYVTGRTTRAQRSEMNRPETIEDTAALVDEAGGRGIAVQVDHLVPDRCALVARIEARTGRAAHSRQRYLGRHDDGVEQVGLGILAGHRAAHASPGRGHARHHQPLRVAAAHQDAGRPGGRGTDGTDEYNATNYRVSFFYDLAKAAVNRMAFALAHELQPYGATAVSLTPGWLRSEAMLEAFGVTEANWRDATSVMPALRDLREPRVRRPGRRRARARSRRARWNGQSLSSGQLAKVYGFTDLDGSQPDAWSIYRKFRAPASPRHHRLSLTPAADQSCGCPGALPAQPLGVMLGRFPPVHTIRNRVCSRKTTLKMWSRYSPGVSLRSRRRLRGAHRTSTGDTVDWCYVVGGRWARREPVRNAACLALLVAWRGGRSSPRAAARPRWASRAVCSPMPLLPGRQRGRHQAIDGRAQPLGERELRHAGERERDLQWTCSPRHDCNCRPRRSTSTSTGAARSGSAA